MTPYCSVCPIFSIPDPDPYDPDLPKHKAAYQSICSSINFLVISTRPDVASALSFLAAYQVAPNRGHYEAALNALRYLVSTSSFGLAYHYDAPTFTKSFVQFPPHHGADTYSESTPPQPDKSHKSTSYSDACWRIQIGKSLPNVTELPLYIFLSISGHIITGFRGPIYWKFLQQFHTTLISVG